MITLNLLSPEKKKELSLSHFYNVIKNVIIIFLLFTIVISIILLVSKYILENTFHQIVAETTLTTKYYNVFNNEIKTFNNKVTAVADIQKKYISWTTLISRINPLIPAPITLYSMSIVTDSKNVSMLFMSGIAPSRENLLTLKNNLDNSLLLSEVTIPLEDLLQKDNVEFNLKAKILVDKLKK